MNTIEFKIDGIGHFISDNYLKVPIYQRSYTWEKSNVNDLLQDIKSSYPNEYFIGTIVVNAKDDGYLEIIDGQQRLATITIFFTAMRNLMQQNNNEKRATVIENEYLFKTDLRTENIEAKLTLNNNDNDFFIKEIIEKSTYNNIKTDRESHTKILGALESVSEFVKNEYDLNSKSFEYLCDLIIFIKNDVKIIIVSVPDEANAFTIFETLNDRGLALSQTDLIKNYLFNKSGSRLSEAQEKWSKFTGAIEAAESEDEILQYIRYHWSSKNGFTREKQLFKSVKDKIINKNQTLTLISEFEQDAQSYLAILNPQHSLWSDYSPNCKEYISTFRELRLTQNKPLLLAILKQFDKKDIEKALRLVVSWSVRNLIAATVGAGTLEHEFSNQAKLINEGNIKNALDLKESIKNFIPSDDQFKNSFEISTVSKQYIARYYLSEIEKSYRDTNEMGPLNNPEKVNLEHILPINYDIGSWPQFNEDAHKSYYKRIGNLTLMDKIMNSKQKNEEFDLKKEFYEKSEIVITKSLDEYDQWTPEYIEQRQKDFAEKAVNVWSLKI